jgi:hypothetical protein
MKTTSMFKSMILIIIVIFSSFTAATEDYKATGQHFTEFNQGRPERAQPPRDGMQARLNKQESKETQFTSNSVRLRVNKDKTLQGSAFLADGETGSISGTIRDTAGLPVGGVNVRAYDINRNAIGGDNNWSDTEGHYAVNELPTGDYYVGAFYRPETGSIWYQGVAPNVDGPPPVHVDAPDATQNIDFILEEGGMLSGHILDQSGNSLGGMGVDVFQHYGYTLFHYCCSDAQGIYKINGLPAGDYYVKTWSETCFVDEWYENTTPTDSERGPVHIDAPNETPNIDFSLALGGAISGSVVLTPRSEGIEGAAISIYYRTIGGSETFSGLTGANGYYSV